MSGSAVKPVSWIGSSYKDFREFPDPVQDSKKSKSGIKTPAEDLELTQRRLKAAEADYKAQLEKGKAS